MLGRGEEAREKEGLVEVRPADNEMVSSFTRLLALGESDLA